MNVLVTGITGFVGSHLAPRLVSAGHNLTGLVRNIGPRGHLSPGVQVSFVRGDITRPDTLPAALQRIDAVFHLAAIPYDQQGSTMQSINAAGTRNLVNAMEQAGVKRLIHLSALAVDSRSPYGYLRTKGAGEDAVRASALDWTIFRPSVLIGEEDEFANALARWLVVTPLFFPLVGDGKSRFQPLWIEDLVTMLLQALADPSRIGKSYDLGGPEILSYEQMVRQILAVLHRSRLLIHMPVPVMRPVVRVMGTVLPRPPATTGLLELLAVDNSTASDSVERYFGFHPRRFSDTISYLNRF
ncbi:MAG: complex I NDUFA9 subunit family protein, partial [Rudaea sp.]